MSSYNLFVGLSYLRGFLTAFRFLDKTYSFLDCSDKLGEIQVVLLLKNHLLKLFECSMIDILPMLREMSVKPDSLSQVAISIDIFLIKLSEAGGPQLVAFDVKAGERDEDGGDDWGVVAIELVDVLESDGGDDGVEVIVNLEIIAANVIEDMHDVRIREHVHIILS